jgi:hypothetical protein
MGESRRLLDLPIAERVLQRIEGEIAAQRAGSPPAHDPPREHVDNARHAHDSAPRHYSVL